VALSKCVWIFIPGDLLKMAAALVVGPLLHRRVSLARVQAG
jgi:biotin transporter BioY